MYKLFIKRMLDIIISLIVMPIVLVFIVFFGIAIKIDDGGPIFYNAERIGKYGKSFKMYKLRSMKVNAPDLRNADGSTYNSHNDPRLTKLGKFLRESSIDELPQLINVLIGNMSLVGPRPDLPNQVAQYSENEKKKLLVKPGITGYSQAYFRNSISWKDRLKKDVDYVNNISFRLDCIIIIKTLSSVISKTGIYVEKRD